MAPWSFLLDVRAFRAPARTGHLISITEISVVHHIIDAHPLVSVIIVVGLPHRPERIHRDFVIIPEIVAEYLQVTPVHIATEYQPLPKRFAIVLHIPAMSILDEGTVRVVQLSSVVAHVEVELP